MKIISKKEEDRIKKLEKENAVFEDRIQKEQEKLYKKIDELYKLETELKDIKSALEKEKKENETLRKYYELDKEPSDEIKAKIHIDLEINRLKEKLMEEILRNSTQPIYYMPPLMSSRIF